VHEEVRKFWEAHYSANVMCASLASRHTLDELESFARTAFSGIANKRLAAPRFSGRLPTSCMSAGPKPGNMSFCIRAAIQAGSFVCVPHLPRPQLPLASMGSS
jgi:Peptidase M16 inactive domain